MPEGMIAGTGDPSGVAGPGLDCHILPECECGSGCKSTTAFFSGDRNGSENLLGHCTGLYLRGAALSTFGKASAYKTGIHSPFGGVLAQFVDSEGTHFSIGVEVAQHPSSPDVICVGEPRRQVYNRHRRRSPAGQHRARSCAP